MLLYSLIGPDNMTALTAASPQSTGNLMNIEVEKKKSIDGPVVVITRHGKTEYNKLGIFTGWNDAPLGNIACEVATYLS